MNLLGSLIRSLKIKFSYSSGNANQNAEHSPNANIVGRDQYNYHPNGLKKPLPEIGTAFFADFHLMLNVHEFHAGGDWDDKRYVATMGTKQIAQFTTTLQKADYEVFGAKDNLGRHVQMWCSVKVEEGRYEGEVKYIEMRERESKGMILLCWLNIPDFTKLI